MPISRTVPALVVMVSPSTTAVKVASSIVEPAGEEGCCAVGVEAVGADGA